MITTVQGVIRSYGGVKATAKAFQTTVNDVRRWGRWGEMPTECWLGLFLGLQERGFVPAPVLFGVEAFAHLPGC